MSHFAAANAKNPDTAEHGHGHGLEARSFAQQATFRGTPKLAFLTEFDRKYPPDPYGEEGAAKQWLYQYDAHLIRPARSLRDWMRRHALYYDGLISWGVPTFITGLPLLLHLSLFVFFAGLALFVWPLDSHIAYALILMSGSLLGFYVIAMFLPLLHVECPSYTPELVQLMRARVYLTLLTNDTLNSLVRKGWMHHVLRFFPHTGLRWLWRATSYSSEAALEQVSHSPRHECKAIVSRAGLLDAFALRLLLQTSSDPEVVAIGAYAPCSATVARFSAEGSAVRRIAGEYFAAFNASTHSTLSYWRSLRSWLCLESITTPKFTSYFPSATPPNVHGERTGSLHPSTCSMAIQLLPRSKYARKLPWHDLLPLLLHLFHAGCLFALDDTNITYVVKSFTVTLDLAATTDRPLLEARENALHGCLELICYLLNYRTMFGLDSRTCEVIAHDVARVCERLCEAQSRIPAWDALPHFVSFVSSQQFSGTSWSWDALRIVVRFSTVISAERSTWPHSPALSRSMTVFFAALIKAVAAIDGEIHPTRTNCLVDLICQLDVDAMPRFAPSLREGMLPT
ncbi:hypothetical protein AURDEDRAFT_119058 [Auricularia subglabra TFB-10046 SS5]|nr:hypothetical protein AURDEDRAFT_119058 [Auricularia subglabra TFB-10046 SS5]